MIKSINALTKCRIIACQNILIGITYMMFGNTLGKNIEYIGDSNLGYKVF